MGDKNAKEKSEVEVDLKRIGRPPGAKNKHAKRRSKGTKAPPRQDKKLPAK